MNTKEYYTVARWHGQGEEGGYRHVVLSKEINRKDTVIADFKTWAEAQTYISNRTATNAN